MRVLFRLLLNLVRLVLYPMRRVAARRAAPSGAYVALEIDGPVVDVTPKKKLWHLRRKAPTTLHGVAELVDAILADATCKGLILTLRSVHAGMASATSLRAQLTRLRTAGREVIVYLPLGGDTKEIFVALAGTRILAGPETTIAPLGFAVHARYLRTALEKAGLLPQIFGRGTYKSAGESLMRDSMSDAQREQLEALLATFYDELVDAIAEGRHLELDRARAMIDEAPYRAKEAVRAGLVDAEAYEDEVETKLLRDEGSSSEGTKPVIVPAARWLAGRRGPTFVPLGEPDVVGVIRVHGPIALAGGSPMPMATDDPIIQLARAARQDPHVRAVILHIDSPGGSALASDRIHHELVRLAAEKPLVACMANVAASGGYYVAAPAHVIVAEPTTITGSIGVVAARFSAAPLLARLGITTSEVQRGARSGLLDPIATLDEDEKRAIDKEIEGIYEAFVQVVADGRGKTVEQIHAVAEGRVWTGKDALTQGLVDKLGGFDLALAVARERLGPGAAKLAPKLLVPRRSSIAPFASQERKDRRVARLVVEVVDALGLDRSVLLAWGRGRRERVFAWLDLSL
jgi:protease-4